MPRQIEREPEVIPVTIRPPIGGLNLDDPRSLIQLGQSPRIKNWRFFKNRLRKRPGYAQLGGSLTDPVMKTDELVKSDGTNRVVALTTKRLYQLVSGTWTEITKSPAGTLGGTDLDSFATEVADNRFVFSQGVNQIQVWDGDTATFAVLSANAPACRNMVNFGGRLLAMDTIGLASLGESAGNRYPT